MKKASLIVSTIVVIAIIAGTLVIASAVSSEVFGGISLIWLSQKPCVSLDQLTDKMELSCKYDYNMHSEINIPSGMYTYQIIELPNGTVAENASLLTGYHPEINPDYEECRGGLCICMVDKYTKRAPSKTRYCDFCYPIARQSEPPAFCCDYGVCRFSNLGNIPNVNGKFVHASEGTQTRIFEGLTFILDGKTDNIEWLKQYCTDLYGGGGEGEFIIDYNHTFRHNETVNVTNITTKVNGVDVWILTNISNSTDSYITFYNSTNSTNYSLIDPPSSTDINNQISVNTIVNITVNVSYTNSSSITFYNGTANWTIPILFDIKDDYNLNAGCCFRKDKLVGSCVSQEINISDTQKSMDFVSFSEGKWPLEGRVAVEMAEKTGGGILLNKTEYKIWWLIGGG